MKNLRGDGLIIHHWDADGVCSAALLLKYLEGRQVENRTPTIGAFYLTEEEIGYAKGFDYVIVADMALPEADVKRISGETKVVVFDHHHQKPIPGVTHVNPVAHGASTTDYPSCTWVVKESLGLPLTLPVVLGFIGDREKRIMENRRFWEITESYLNEAKTSLEDLLSLVALIDGSYRVGDKAGVEEAPRLINGYTSPEDFRGNDKWRRNLRLFEEKMEELMAEPPEEEDGVLLKRLHTRYSVISAITRRIAWGTGRDTIVVNTGFFDDHDQLYSRSVSTDMQPMIARANELMYNAGGKKDVLGAIVPKEQTEFFIGELLRFFKEK